MKRLIKKLIICFIVFGLFCSHVIAAPIITGVSGTVATGQNIIISGSSFGTKSPAAPLSFLNFEDALVGTISNPYHGWTPSSGGGSTHWPIVVSSYGGRTSKMLRCNPSASTGDMKSGIWIDGPAGKRYFYMTYDSYKSWPAGQSSRSKLFRIQGLVQNMPVLVLNMGMEAFVLLGNSGNSYVGPYVTLDRQVWSRDEVFLDSGTQGSTNATAKFWEHLPGSRINSWQSPAFLLLEDSEPVQSFLLGYEFCDMTSQISHYLDNLYVDNTQSRVEIGNASTWNACTRREIQIPSAWSSGSITVNVRQGTFPLGAAWLYVVDSSGNINSSGVPVTFGSDGGGSGGVPNPPLNLRRVE